MHKDKYTSLEGSCGLKEYIKPIMKEMKFFDGILHRTQGGSSAHGTGHRIYMKFYGHLGVACRQPSALPKKYAEAL